MQNNQEEEERPKRFQARIENQEAWEPHLPPKMIQQNQLLGKMRLFKT